MPHEHSGGAGFRPTALYPVKTGVHPLVRFQFTSAAVLAALASVACSNEPPKRPDLADLLNQQLAERRAAAVASIQLSMEIDTAWQSRVRAAPGLGGGLLSIDLQDFLTSTHAPPVLLEGRLIDAVKTVTGVRIWISIGDFSHTVDAQLDCPHSVRDSLKHGRGTYLAVARLTAVDPRVTPSASVWVGTEDSSTGSDVQLSSKPMLMGRCSILTPIPSFLESLVDSLHRAPKP